MKLQRTIHLRKSFMLMNEYQTMQKSNSAFSGLEAAIVLIAFVVVAAVFAYATLGTGIWATEEAQESTVAGFRQASSVVYVEGALYATLNSLNDSLDTITFYLAIPETGRAQDLTKMLIVYTHSVDSTIHRVYEYGGASPSGGPNYKFGVAGGVEIMNPGDKLRFEIIDVGGPVPGGWFRIEIKPEIGASTLVTKNLNDGYAGGAIFS